MSTIEIALAGVLLLTVAAPLALTAVRRRGLAGEALWGLLLPLCAVVYALAAPVPGTRLMVMLGGIVVWGAVEITAVLRSGSGRVAPAVAADFGWSAYGGQAARILAASAPLLLVAAERAPVPPGWSDAGATALLVAGLALALAGRSWRRVVLPAMQRHDRRYLATTLVAWAFYLYALATSEGYLTVFAPILMSAQARRLRSLGIEGGATPGAEDMSQRTQVPACR